MLIEDPEMSSVCPSGCALPTSRAAMMPLAPGTVVDDDLLAETLGQLLRDEPADEIGRAAGGEADDEANRTLRIGVGRRVARARHAQWHACEQRRRSQSRGAYRSQSHDNRSRFVRNRSLPHRGDGSLHVSARLPERSVLASNRHGHVLGCKARLDGKAVRAGAAHDDDHDVVRLPPRSARRMRRPHRHRTSGCARCSSRGSRAGCRRRAPGRAPR